MRALVVSGGASKISFGVGVVTELQKKNRYDLFVGISAGSMIGLFAAVNKLDFLYQNILSLKLEDLFNIVPVTKKGGLSIVAKLRILFGKTSLSKNKRTRNKLSSMFDDSDYSILMTQNAQVIVGVTNYNTKQIEYPCLNKCSKNDILDWVYISSNLPCLTEPSKTSGFWYFDGGVVDYFGIMEAVKAGATDIDVVLHSPLEKTLTDEDNTWEPKNMLEIAKRTVIIMCEALMTNNIVIANILAKAYGVNITFYSPVSTLTEQVYDFNESQTRTWYETGSSLVREGKGKTITA